MKTNMQIMGAGIRELCDSPLLVLYPQVRTLIEIQKAAYAELDRMELRISKLEAALGIGAVFQHRPESGGSHG